MTRLKPSSPLGTPKGEDALVTASLMRARAASLHEALPIATWGSAGLGLAFALMYWGQGFDVAVEIWLLIGAAAMAVRLAMAYFYKSAVQTDAQGTAATQFLWGCTLCAALAGITWAWGWMNFYPHLDAHARTAFMMGNVALLFGGLYSYSAFPPTYIAFSALCLPAGIYQAYLQGSASGDWIETTIGFGLSGLLSGMFAFRTARNFRVNHLLQEREINLLQEITAKRDEAVSATLAKSRFLASVSHDLRQPMHAINLYLSSLSGNYERQMGEPTDAHARDAVRASIKSLHDSTLYLNSMFESLLDISRLDAGSVAADIRHTSLARMTSQLKSDYARLAQAEGLLFNMELPPQFEVMEFHTDPALLERLLRNLIVNAFRYTRRGGVRVSVVARTRTVDFRVIDTGPGIERGLRQRIFEEFFQVAGSQAHVGRGSNTGRGIGLGLSISTRLADKLGTEIRLHSHVGHGSVFAVRIPMRYALRQAGDDLRGGEPLAEVRLRRGTFVAVIDDDLEILRSTRMMLESCGATVFTAVSSSEAIHHLGGLGQLPDVLISDFRLGAEDGIAAIRRVREEFNADIPALLITGDTSAELVSVFRDSGLRVLHKPVSGDTLLKAVRTELIAATQPGQAAD
jgi:signal transduction histidine kinase/ActR/RegA family two-component response regulator